MELPCPRCGSKETIGTFCKDCLRALHPLVMEAKRATALVCETCGRVKARGKWGESPTPALEGALRVDDSAIIDAARFEIPEFERKPGLERTILAKAIMQGRNEQAPAPYEEEYEIPLSYTVVRCPQCKKKGTTYYEGILQARNETSESQEFIERYLERNAERGVHLTGKKRAGSGTDYYLSSNRAVGHLARRLHAEFGGEITVSAQHFSEDKQEGKILYRTNAHIELPEYAKGAIVRKDGLYYHILGISRKVHAEDLKSHGETSFPYRKGEAKVLPLFAARVVQSHPLLVLHPETFQPAEPIRSKYSPAELEPDQEVLVAVEGEKMFLPMQR